MLIFLSLYIVWKKLITLKYKMLYETHGEIIANNQVGRGKQNQHYYFIFSSLSVILNIVVAAMFSKT